MKYRRGLTALVVAILIAPLLSTAADIRKKSEAVASIDQHQAELIGLSDRIWSFAETALRETRSAWC
jgi:aminobenzoyl-glutamate utilization protein B